MEEAVYRDLIGIVGPENFSDKLIDRVSYSYDGSSFSRRPDCAVWAGDTSQISAILRLADRQRIPVIARGAGTGISGNAVPAMGGIVLDLSRMNRILSIRIADRLAVVQPGVVYDSLQAALAPHGFFFPPDPASGKVCTIGGNAATNAGGIRGAKYGTTRDYVLGLQVVLAGGDVMRIGADTMKSSSGLDLVRLFVGSEGMLGIFSEITLKISPRPAATATATAVFDRLEKAGDAVTAIMHSGVTPSALELMDTTVIEMIRTHSEVDLPPAAALILAETDGSSREDVEKQMAQLTDLFGACGAKEIRIARSDAEARQLWTARKSIGGLIGSIEYSFMPEDLTVPMSRITDYLLGCRAISGKRGLQILNFGHAGDGNFHTNILYDPADRAHLTQLEHARYDLHRLACDLGGTLTGEHGIGMTKARFMPLEHDPVALKAMRAVKNALDPNNILNPGKMGL
ncbi:MAG: FAD-binding protein [Desulfobacteraceae bacterium]|nr:MAG: FAD-binding protein [Desulfobacteraceae bacterium]